MLLVVVIVSEGNELGLILTAEDLRCKVQRRNDDDRFALTIRCRQNNVQSDTYMITAS